MLRPIVALLLTVALFSGEARAEVGPQTLYLPGICGPRAELVAILKAEHTERTVIIGAVDDVAIMEVYANPAAGTWSVVMTMVADGKACILVSGDKVQFIEPPKAKKGIAL